MPYMKHASASVSTGLSCRTPFICLFAVRWGLTGGLHGDDDAATIGSTMGTGGGGTSSGTRQSGGVPAAGRGGGAVGVGLVKRSMDVRLGRVELWPDPPVLGRISHLIRCGTVFCLVWGNESATWEEGRKIFLDCVLL